MSWGFEKGRVYNRRSDMHARFGGQQQGGIVTPAQHSLVIVITGEEGFEHGYADRLRADGVFEYSGEGQLGNMQIERGNRAIAEHSVAGKSLLLFRRVKHGLRFEGEMVGEGYHQERAPDQDGKDRDAIVFELRPLNSVAETVEANQSAENVPLAELRARAFQSALVDPQSPSSTRRNVYQRSYDVRVYVLARAKGNCEGCSAPAPFIRPDGSPYLEPHHVRRLSDGGPDHPAHVIALCPTCHRQFTPGADGPSYNAQLSAMLTTIEPA